MLNEDPDFTDPKVLRTKAEEKLKSKQEQISMSSSEYDVKRIVHELQVHQVELEIQNEELRLANERTEAALKKYTMMYDFAPMGYLTLDRAGVIHELNFTAAEMLGNRRISLLNRNLKFFLSDESLTVFNHFFNKIYSENTKESCQVMLGNDPQNLVDVYMEGIVTGDDEKCLLSIVDISSLEI
ncbi:MAG: hypothetical protein Q8O72_11030 [Bacteroidales bacterium]|jgi:PAS domain-containing protein|nr:hypothetical protein [Bacteroidales bacterium]